MRRALGYNTDERGKTIVLTCSDGRTLETGDYDKALGFLLHNQDWWGIVPHIDRFVAALVSIMPYPLSDDISQGGEVTTPTGRVLYYRQLRLFSINRRTFYGLQFATEDTLDANSAIDLYPKVINSFRSMGVPEVESLSSALGAFRPVLNKVDFPRFQDLPDESRGLSNDATAIMGRDWRDVYQVGAWGADEVWDYDQVSGYPAIVSGLPDIRQARYFEADTVPCDLTRVWGVLTGTLKVEKAISPFVWKGEGDNRLYPVGEWEDRITTDQWWLLNKYGVGQFKIDRGRFLELPETVTYPLQHVIERLYRRRSDPSPLVRKLAKAVLVAISGGFHSQYEEKDGAEFNPIYACMTRSRCMVRTAAFIYHNKIEDNLISVLVDGCLATKRVPVENAPIMGTWRINEPSPALVVNTTYQWQGEQHPGRMYYSDVMALIREHPERANFGELDLNLVKYKRAFDGYPETGADLLSCKFKSEPFEVKGGKINGERIPEV